MTHSTDDQTNVPAKQTSGQAPIRLPEASTPLGRAVAGALTPLIKRLVRLDHLNDLYLRSEGRDTAEFLKLVLENLHITVNVSEQDTARIPASGPCVVVANHPFGGIEGVILASIMRSVRPDVQIMANYMLGVLPRFREMLIDVDPFDTGASATRNIAPLKRAVRFVKNGGMMGVFPAGEVSSFHLSKRMVTDPPWSPTVGRIIKMTGASVLPIHFSGRNSLLFQLAGLLHPRLRTLMLPRELLKRQNTEIDLTIGNLIKPAKLAELGSDEELINYLRLRTYVLKNRTQQKHVFTPSARPPGNPVAPAQDANAVEAELFELPEEQILERSDDWMVFIARREQAPKAVLEIGRLREMTFREVGEGTGEAIDLDRFDDYYLHLGLWSMKNREIAGAYRIGLVDEILANHGKQGLYTNTLFEYRDSFLDQINPGLEMGRSFIQRKYQKSYTPLLSLWKGIGAFVGRNFKYKVLFGPVTISNDYQSFSQELMMRFLKREKQPRELARMVQPKTPPDLENMGGPKRHKMPLTRLESKALSALCKDIEEVGQIVSEVESDGKGVPVLLRQYLKLGGQMLAFNVDEDFANALDGLVLVDLTKTDRRILSRYIGKDTAKEFLAHHGITE